MQKIKFVPTTWMLTLLLIALFTTNSQAQWSQSATAIFPTVLTKNVGINTSTPNTKLHINGTGIENNGVTAVVRIVSGNGAQNMLLDGNEIDALADGLFLNNNTNQNIVLAMGGGNVGIGTTTPTYKLAVNGTIRAKEVRVETGWADYVFGPEYTLRPLTEVESFVKENQHLPGIPSATEIQENGLAVGEVQTKMMEKIEELTLYLIQVNKQNEELRQRLELLEKTALKRLSSGYVSNTMPTPMPTETLTIRR